MIGMNVFFHLASAVGLIALVWALLKARRQRDFLRELVTAAARARAAPSRAVVRLYVESPAQFLARFAAALGLPFEAAALPALPPARISPAPLMDFFWSCGIIMIRCRCPDKVPLEVELVTAQADEARRAGLEAALGGQVRVLLTSPSTASKENP